MKFQVVLLIALMSTAMLMDSCDAWFWRDLCRFVVGKVCTVTGCAVTGPIGCRVAITSCSWGSTKVCGKRKRRELMKKTLEKDDHLIPLPALFEAYDMNEDDKISAQELALTAGIDEFETQNVAFPLCDTDGDGFLSRKEFINSPLMFEDIRDIEMEYREIASEMKGDVDNKISSINAPDDPSVKSTKDKIAA
ncbi:unnamed protein product [Owenia fusiformis]|uniref:EF-hand domain-containing protein n=1 Tax=Owenia fusiformis TaxID=6347 RepID=A0A8S4NK06_OWEFU|nr:unnamed protein product [Owenia fusiformis]